MRIAGIIAEYNPLHNGHAYHIQKTRERFDRVVVAMSGSFVQRGEIAVYDKFQRARWAVEAGADMVVELPTAFVLQGARGFAAGGVKTLRAAGATALSFGTECDDLSLLRRAAALLDHEDTAIQSAMRAAMKTGQSFPRARETATAQHPENADALAALRQPNFLLGAEYLRAANALAPDMEICPIERRGAGHDADTPDGIFASASAIRKHLMNGDRHAIESAVPAFVLRDIERLPFARPDALDSVFLYALRRLTPPNAARLFGATEGLEHLLCKAADQPTLAEAWSVVKSKRYTLARIRRLFCAALLDIEATLIEQANAADTPYLRVLAFQQTAQPLLRAIADRGTPPRLQNKRDFDALSGLSATLAHLDVLATDVQALALALPGKQDFVAGTAKPR